MSQTLTHYIGSGQVHIREKAAGKPFEFLGNVSKLAIAFDESKKEITDFTNPGGGVADSVTKISSATGELTSHTLSSANIAKAIRGDQEVLAAGDPITDEVHPSTGIAGEFIGFDHLYDASQAVTVKKNDDTPLTLGSDYELTPNGLKVSDGGGIDGTGIKVSYTALGEVTVQMLTNSGKEYELYFDGLNEADSGNPVQVVIHRIKFSPVGGLDFIGEDFGELALSFDMLADSTITGTGKSKYARVTMKA